MDYFIPQDQLFVKREKNKARVIRNSAWWKNQLAKRKCYYCGNIFEIKDLNMDHIVPIIRGGLSSKKNIVVSCRKCNSEKKFLLPIEWKSKL